MLRTHLPTLFKILSLFQSRQTERFHVFYSPRDADFFLMTTVEARTPYEAMRQFDTNPEFFDCIRRGLEIA